MSDRYRDYYEGKILGDSGFDENIDVNMVFVDMKQSVPAQYSKNPKIFVAPETPGAEQEAIMGELLVNKKWSDLQMKPICRESIKNTKLDGVCAFKTYFNFKKDFTKEEWTGRVKNDDVRTDIVPLCNLLKDPDAISYNHSSWIAHEVVDKVSRIAKKFNIPAKDITVTKSTPGSKDLSDSVRPDFEYGTYYEIEDREKEEIMYIVDGLDKFAKKPTKKTYDYDTMYDFLMYNDIPGRANPKPDYAFWEDQLIELCTYRTMEVNHARRGNSKFITYGEFTETQKTQLKSSNDKTVLELNPEQSVSVMQHPQLDNQLFIAEQQVRGDIQLISKQAPRQDPGSDKTATEIKAVEFASREVSGENVERLEEVMASIATKWLSLMKDNYSKTQVVALTEMTESEFIKFGDTLNKDKELLKGGSKRPFLEFTKEDLKGKLKATIQAGSTIPDNDQTRVAKLQGFAQYVSTLQLTAGVDPEQMLKEGEEVFGVKNDNLLLRKDNPMEESRLLNDGAYIAPRINENHDKHIAIHEQESNGNNENMIHVLGHKMFKNQMEKNNAAMQATMPQLPVTGSSFLGGGQQDVSALPAQAQPTGQPVVPSGGPIPGGQ